MIHVIMIHKDSKAIVVISFVYAKNILALKKSL